MHKLILAAAVAAIAGPAAALDGLLHDGMLIHSGGFGLCGIAEELSDVSLACRQTGPIRFKAKFEQGDVVFKERRSLIFKTMQIVRGCDAKRNVLVYLIYTDKLIDGSPKNSVSAVPIDPATPIPVK